MTEPIVLRKPFVIAFVTLLQIALPPLVAVGSLGALMGIYDVSFDRKYGVLASLVTVLAVLLLQPPRNLGSQLIVRRVPLVVSWLLRWGVLVAILLTIGYATKFSEDFSRRVTLSWVLITPAFLIGSALLLHEMMRRVLYDPASARRVIFAGCNETSQSLSQRLRTNPELCMSVAGFFDDRSRERLGVDSDITLLGRLSELSAFVKANSTDVIFIALPIRHITRVLDLLDDLRDTTASIYYVPDLFMFDMIQARTGEISGIPVVAMCETPFYGYRGVIKRVFDMVASAAALIVLMPLLAAIAVLVKFSSPGPVIFKQRRYGLDGREIYIYKFRTMTVMEDGQQVTQARKEDNRITSIGRILRQWSLDELPQLFNVLQGTMSLVGPRPHAVAHNEQYRKLIKGYMIRHKVLPGITGLAQINGCRGETAKIEEMQARVEYDLEYLRRWSPMLDLKILGLTVIKAFGDDKAY
jgi:putative colanic acid biosysnthesis UDP-glucose lipid carrier transferase